MNAAEQDMQQRLDTLNQMIDTALDTALRNRSGLTLVAVSKRQPLAVIHQAYQLGIRDFGESQIQEGVPKVKACPDDITWHFIGHLQKNKVRKAVLHFHYLHSIDSLSLLHRVDAIATEERVCPKIFLQVNYALDSDKYGLHPEAVETVLEAGLAMKHVACIGLMGIPPANADDERIQAYFQGMVELRDQLKARFPDWPGNLSLGMSGDFPLAIQAGSHYIRVGSKIFGDRI
ncbi:YggS family pyridoxal phosphate-dependent enzyme [Acanthopleuribacter pedis]|uniref:Pyridoxal phosphate homeostasis protein n=1 Tax=Acanthopleuribacter pedis TaxID=442870 RepID=A0A8J7PZZ7_9BACT|nr:YggS family pyridoxal phosphate-dependent enzyme [Acanthopleuribacter pedis]MBO1316854.1 YggS family pyridoxal phosphate-dependent enzyme [Acanthopleuribacter pedis]